MTRKEKQSPSKTMENGATSSLRNIVEYVGTKMVGNILQQFMERARRSLINMIMVSALRSGCSIEQN